VRRKRKAPAEVIVIDSDDEEDADVKPVVKKANRSPSVEIKAEPLSGVQSNPLIIKDEDEEKERVVKEEKPEDENNTDAVVAGEAEGPPSPTFPDSLFGGSDVSDGEPEQPVEDEEELDEGEFRMLNGRRVIVDDGLTCLTTRQKQMAEPAIILALRAEAIECISPRFPPEAREWMREQICTTPFHLCPAGLSPVEYGIEHPIKRRERPNLLSVHVALCISYYQSQPRVMLRGKLGWHQWDWMAYLEDIEFDESAMKYRRVTGDTNDGDDDDELFDIFPVSKEDYEWHPLERPPKPTRLQLNERKFPPRKPPVYIKGKQGAWFLQQKELTLHPRIPATNEERLGCPDRVEQDEEGSVIFEGPKRDKWTQVFGWSQKTQSLPDL